MERVRHPEITPLELSDVRVSGVTLWASSQTTEFPAALREVLEILHAGGGSWRLRKPIPDVLAGFEAVFLTGGRATETGLRKGVSGLPCPVIFGKESAFGGECGGFDLLRSRGLTGWVADLGKSQFKLAAPGRRWSFPREWGRLRAPGKVSPAEQPGQRRRLREFIALKLQIAMAEYGRQPHALVFALPTKVADDGAPYSSNYAGMRGDCTLLPDALAMAGLPGLPLLVLNDAELAAFSAITDERLAGFRKVLVLTLGFGIGAALIDRSGDLRLSAGLFEGSP